MNKQNLALSALALAYIEARTLIFEDLRLIVSVAGRLLPRRFLEYKRQVNFFYVLENYAKSQPDAIALRYPRQVRPPCSTDTNLDELFVVEEYTYKEFYDNVLRYSAILRNDYGVTSGSSVALDCMNKPDFVFIWFAVWCLGALPAFINYNLTEKSLIHCITVANVTHLFVDEDPAVANLVTPCEEELKSAGCLVCYLDETFRAKAKNAWPIRAPNSVRHPEHKFGDAAILIYTSGTTGMPKPAVMSWKKATLSSNLYAATIKLKPQDVVYSSMPLYHSTASVLGLLSTLNTGATFAIGHKFSTSTFWTQVKLCKATYIQYVGETCRYLLKAPHSVDERAHQVRCAYGNGMRPDVWMQFKERFNIEAVGEFYASTESPSALTNFQEGQLGIGAVAKYGSFASWVLFSFHHRLVKMDPENETEFYRDPNSGFCIPPGVNEPGEMLTIISNPSKIKESFQGYYGNNKATEEKIARDVFKKGDMYFRTGDLLRQDKDNLVYFVDRLGDTFRWKSENVSTNEVEDVISSFDQNKYIHQVVVVGVQVPEHEGRAGFAVIAPHDIENLPDPRLLAEYLIAQLPRYAVPVFIRFVERISTTHNNKIQKGEYRKQKFPNLDENIWWLNGNTYSPLKPNDWDMIGAGKIKL